MFKINEDKLLFNLHLLTTKTNIFFSITDEKHKIILQRTPRCFGFKSGSRRTLFAGQKLVRETLNIFFEKIMIKKKNVNFILYFKGAKFYLMQLKLMKYILFKLRTPITFIINKQMFPHNGCPLEPKKRRRRKGKNKWVKHFVKKVKSKRFLFKKKNKLINF